MTVEAFRELVDSGGLGAAFAAGGPVGLSVGGELVARVLPPSSAPVIRSYAPADEPAVVALWQACGLTRPWNDPLRDIARKCADDGEPFFVAEAGGTIAGTAMTGYDGHRGWINYLAVDPAQRRSGIGRALVGHAERWLLARGCPKLNLQIRAGNDAAIAFYRRIGYSPDGSICLGKRLIDDANQNQESA